MTCKSIYDLSLSLLGEDISGDFSKDYESRAPHLIAAFCSIEAENDALYRKHFGLEAQSINLSGKPSLNLDEVFPLSDIFFTACGYYLASSLIFDSDLDRSISLFEKYKENIKAVFSSIPFENSKILDIYKN